MLLKMLEVLNKYGFIFRSTCNCAGPKTHKYKNKDFTIYWNKNRKVFRLKMYGKSITTLKPETEIEDILKKYLPPEIQAGLN